MFRLLYCNLQEDNFGIGSKYKKIEFSLVAVSSSASTSEDRPAILRLCQLDFNLKSAEQ
jgi:hypothetical protein